MSIVDDTLADHRAEMLEVGEEITVRRYSGTGAGRPVSAEAVVLGRPAGYQPRDLVGGIVQGGRRVILLNDPAAVVPAGKVALADMLPLSKSDKLVIGGRELSIDGIDDLTRRVQGMLIALEVQVTG